MSKAHRLHGSYVSGMLLEVCKSQVMHAQLDMKAGSPNGAHSWVHEAHIVRGPMTVPLDDSISVEVRAMFGDNIIGSGGDSAVRRIVLRKDGSETLLAVKGSIAAAFGGAVVPERLMLFFGPNARRMGSQYVGDPAGEDSTLCLTDFSVLAWLARFPQWRLGVKMLPGAPPPPGVAEHRAAALAEKKDPDKAVQEARAKGDIPTIMELPAPWGPKPYVKDPNNGFAPAKYPPESSPMLDAGIPVA